MHRAQRTVITGPFSLT
uniref:Uncharacterized protein n=1 Tax=Lepeophtheirus salmonis TaxID=72036 RepID=A0A0K2UJ58_LEPSM